GRGARARRAGRHPDRERHAVRRRRGVPPARPAGRRAAPPRRARDGSRLTAATGPSYGGAPMSPAVLFLFLVQPFALALAADHLLARRRPAAIAPALLYAGGAVLACGLVGAPLGW